MHKTVRLINGLIFFSMMQSAIAARPLGPPIAELLRDPGHTRIVVATARVKSGSFRILFEIGQRLSGDSPDEVLLRTDEETSAEVDIGHSYVVAWSYLRKNPILRKVWEIDPDGPSIVEVRGLGSTALFEDTPEILFLFTPGKVNTPERKGKQLDALLAQMRYEDQRGRDLVSAELLLRPDLSEEMNQLRVEKLKTVLKDTTLLPQHRNFLLQSALRLPLKLRSPWLREEFRRNITRWGTEYDLGSSVPGLIKTSAQGLRQTGGPDDIELLSSLFYANNPGVAKAALETMQHIDPGETAVMVKQALDQNGIHNETRRALEAYLKQTQL